MASRQRLVEGFEAVGRALAGWEVGTQAGWLVWALACCLGSMSELRGFSALEGFLLFGGFFLRTSVSLVWLVGFRPLGLVFFPFVLSLGPAQARVCSRLGGSLSA
ncbi:hypothetical protein OIU76_009404 [Salix suchowensis]|nr:hypothetical protein OIU76_009404 [Salix suchowensis]